MRLSATRRRIVEFVHNFTEQRGYAPTIGEVQVALGLSSKSLVEYHLKVLEEECSMPSFISFIPTRPEHIDGFFELASLSSSDVVYDLGCGDARSLVTAAQRYGAKGVGFEIDPRLVADARSNVRRNGVEDLVRIEEADIFTVDLSPASVVFVYLTQRLLWRLVPQLERLRPGSRVVSHEYQIPGARPARIVKVPGPPDGPPDTEPEAATVMHVVYLWRMPWQKQPTIWAEE